MGVLSDMTTQLKISGMSCGHCVAAVTKSLKGVPGVESVEVTLDPGTAQVIGTASLEDLVHAVEEEGYEAAPVSL